MGFLAGKGTILTWLAHTEAVLQRELYQVFTRFQVGRRKLENRPDGSKRPVCTCRLSGCGTLHEEMHACCEYLVFSHFWAKHKTLNFRGMTCVPLWLRAPPGLQCFFIRSVKLGTTR